MSDRLKIHESIEKKSSLGHKLKFYAIIGYTCWYSSASLPAYFTHEAHRLRRMTKCSYNHSTCSQVLSLFEGSSPYPYNSPGKVDSSWNSSAVSRFLLVVSKRKEHIEGGLSSAHLTRSDFQLQANCHRPEHTYCFLLEMTLNVR